MGQPQLDLKPELKTGEIEIIEADPDRPIRYEAREHEGKLVKTDQKAMFLEEFPNQVDRKLLEDREEKQVVYIGSSAYICVEIYKNYGSKLKEFTIKCHGFTPYATDRKESINEVRYYDSQFGMVEHKNSFHEALQLALDWLNCRLEGSMEIGPEQGVN